MDTASGWTAYSTMPVDSSVISVEIKVFTPTIGVIIFDRIRVIKSGEMLTISDEKLYAFCADEKRFIAVIQSMMICVE